MLSCVQLFEIPRSIARQPPLSMEFSRQECWSGLLFPSPEDLPNPGIEPGSPAMQAYSLPSEPPGKPLFFYKVKIKIMIHVKHAYGVDLSCQVTNDIVIYIFLPSA